MKGNLILLYYVVHTFRTTSKGKPIMNTRLYPTLNDVRFALSKMAKRRKITWLQLYESNDVLIMRCYGRFDDKTRRVVRVYDEVSKRALQSNGI